MKSILRLLAILLLGFTSYSVEASHIIGGDIQYEYLGNNQYKIRLVLYRQQTGIGLGATQNVNINSATCGLGLNHQVSLVQAEFQATGAFDCIAQSTASGFVPMVNIYESTTPLTLTQRCSDYKISWSQCCRPGGISNIVNSAGAGFYFEAELNNRLGIGTNSSPFFVTDPIAYICVNSSISFLQGAIEPDGDSLNYGIIDPRSAANTNVAYTAPFSAQNPFTTDPNDPYTIDAKSGNITFTATGPGEVSVIAIRVEEYRFDSTYFFWEKVGSSNREIQVVVAGNCVPLVNQGVRLDPSAPGVSLDSQGRQVREYDCLDSSVTLQFTIPVECVSVSSDGTDFRLTAPNGQPIPMRDVTTYCDVNGETDSITLNLYKPLIFNGDYFLYSKVGTDGNTLLNKCGKPMGEFDTIILKVSNCLDPVFDITNVSVDGDRRNEISFMVDTNTIPSAFLDFVRIYRSDDSGTTYNLLGATDPSDLVYYDPAPGPAGVDAQHYYYSMELVANGQNVGTVGEIHTMNLMGDLSDPNSMPLSWSNYGGLKYPQLLSTQYMVQWATKNDTGGWTWVDTDDVNNLPTSDSTYTLSLPNLAAGEYAVRIMTLPNLQGFESESNWITFSVTVDPPNPPGDPTPVVIPNIFTPNGDGVNDTWDIEGIQTWSNRSVSVFDRWGRKVWNSEAYDPNMPFDGKDNSGQELPDGTYFYVIELLDAPTDKTETHNGSITILTNK